MSDQNEYRHQEQLCLLIKYAKRRDHKRYELLHSEAEERRRELRAALFRYSLKRHEHRSLLAPEALQEFDFKYPAVPAFRVALLGERRTG